VLYTSLDADSWIPSVYFEEIDLYLSKHDWNMNRYIFAPNQMFTRNHLNVPMFTRVHDQTNGLMQFMLSTNLTNSYFPLSCYSMSFSTLKNMGFFDTNADAIADDYHTAMKAYWKNQG
jgi:cellulose synthase/poly-beta-1,6-N-acetylglucosamine synthase-like glycosyltransferase